MRKAPNHPTQPNQFAGSEVLGVPALHAPALDRYFAELDTLNRLGGLNPESERELMRRHGLEPA